MSEKDLELVKEAAYKNLGIRTVESTINLKEAVLVCQYYHRSRLLTLLTEIEDLDTIHPMSTGEVFVELEAVKALINRHLSQ